MGVVIEPCKLQSSQVSSRIVGQFDEYMNSQRYTAGPATAARRWLCV